MITDLNIYFFTSTLCHKINFFLIQFSHIDIKAPSEKFHTDDIFIYPSIIHIPASKNRIADACVAQIKFIQRFQIHVKYAITPFSKLKNLISESVLHPLYVSQTGNEKMQ